MKNGTHQKNDGHYFLRFGTRWALSLRVKGENSGKQEVNIR